MWMHMLKLAHDSIDACVHMYTQKCTCVGIYFMNIQVFGISQLHSSYCRVEEKIANVPLASFSSIKVGSCMRERERERERFQNIIVEIFQYLKLFCLQEIGEIGIWKQEQKGKGGVQIDLSPLGTYNHTTTPTHACHIKVLKLSY